jgi:hypothetical protein
MRLPTSLIAAIAPLLLLGTLSLSVLAEPEDGVRGTYTHIHSPLFPARYPFDIEHQLTKSVPVNRSNGGSI